MGSICFQSAPQETHQASQDSNSAIAGSNSPTKDDYQNNANANTSNTANSKGKNSNKHSDRGQLLPDVTVDTEDEKDSHDTNAAGTNAMAQVAEHGTNNGNTKYDIIITSADDVNDKNNHARKSPSGRSRDENLPLLEGSIDAERYLIYKDHIIQHLKFGGNTDTNIVKVRATVPEDSDEKDEVIEQTMVTYSTKDGGSKETEIELTCSICLDDELTPSQLIEYTFDNENWYLSNCCTECNSYYRASKFENWKNFFENETCAATLRRLVNVGPVTNIFDHVVYPSPESEKHLYQVKNHQGKMVDIPRPVSAMRIWDPSKNQYKEVRARLDGVPGSEEEIQAMWSELLEVIKTKFGEDVIGTWVNDSTPGGPDSDGYED